MSKRSFIRRRGELVDSYEEHGKSMATFLPQSFLEPLADEERSAALERAATPDAQGSIALHEDSSLERMEQELRGLEQNNIEAAGNLTIYVDRDPRVRPALIRAVERVPARDLANFVQALGMVGGDGSVEVLKRRLSELASSSESFADDPFFNFIGGSLVSTACAILQLDRQSVEAGVQLVRVMREHPCRFNKHSAAMNAAEIFHRYIRTAAFMGIRAVLVECLDSEDDELVLSASAALFEIEAERSETRMRTVLSSAEPMLQERAAHALIESRAKWTALPSILEWMRNRASARMKLAYGFMLQLCLRDGELEEIVAEGLRDESPSLRLGAVGYLEKLPKEMARRLAQTALNDEPDPGLRAKLAAHGG